MLQINPSEFLRLGRLMNNSLEIIDENVRYLKSNNQDSPELKELLTIITNIKNNTDFITNIINDFEKATGEDINKLLSHNYSDRYYNDKLLKYYANII